MRQINEEESSQQVKDLQWFDPDIKSDDENLNAHADFRRAVVRINPAGHRQDFPGSCGRGEFRREW